MPVAKPKLSFVPSASDGAYEPDGSRPGHPHGSGIATRSNAKPHAEDRRRKRLKQGSYAYGEGRAPLAPPRNQRPDEPGESEAGSPPDRPKDSFDREMRGGLSTVREESGSIGFASPAPSGPSLQARGWRDRARGTGGTSRDKSSHSVSSVRSGSVGVEIISASIEEGLEPGIPPSIQKELQRRRASSSSDGVRSQSRDDRASETASRKAGTGLEDESRGDAPDLTEGSTQGEADDGIVYTIVPRSMGSHGADEEMGVHSEHVTGF